MCPLSFMSRRMSSIHYPFYLEINQIESYIFAEYHKQNYLIFAYKSRTAIVFILNDQCP